LGAGAAREIEKFPDLELVAVFSRRPVEIAQDVPVVRLEEAGAWKDRIDVMVLCGGSATDLPEQGPQFARDFCTVDSFDNHAEIPSYLAAVDEAARAGGRTSIISAGWDPGLFSLMRVMMGAVLPEGMTQTFWGKGVSQGHSSAIRALDGVVDAVQYTVPDHRVMNQARSGEPLEFTAGERHTRLCFVVAAEGADTGRIEREIKEMPNYFAGYNTEVHFISAEDLLTNHSRLPHGGSVIHSGKTGEENVHLMELLLKLDSNPEFTASILLAYARAVYRLHAQGEVGARTVFDIPPVFLAASSRDTLITDLL
jgi:diaminopimelate dehydrogenase